VGVVARGVEKEGVMSSSYTIERQLGKQPKEFKELVGWIGNLYGRAGLCPPIDLVEYAKRWLSDGITPSHCIEQTRLYLDKYARSFRLGSGEGSLPFLDRIIRETWLKSQYPAADAAKGDEKFNGESQESPVIEEGPGEPVKPWWAPKEPLRHEPAQSAQGYAAAFLRRELADGELPTSELNKRARAARIADRTLDRARKKLGVVSRRTGFGRTGQHWVSLPKAA
jgi:hypothetical protein